MYVLPYSWATKTHGQQRRQAAHLKESAKQLLFRSGQWSSDSSCSATDGSFDIGLGKPSELGNSLLSTNQRPFIYRPISSQPFSAGCHGNRHWRPIWKVAWWARVSCRRSRMYGIQCKLVQFCPVIPYSTTFFFCRNLSHVGGSVVCSDGKRNRSFTKNIITFAAVLILISMCFLPFFFLSIANRSICVHHTVPGYIDQNVFGLQSTAKKKWLSLHEKL